MTMADSGIESGSSPEMAAAANAAAAAAVAYGRYQRERLHHHQQQQQHAAQQHLHRVQRANSDTPLSNMSRTHQYRKVMKPLLERKRRARINRCLDELKDIMVGALQTEGESITKLEKADVLELTVRHLGKLKKQNALGLTPEVTYASRFKAGYAHCAQEVSRFVASQEADLETQVSNRLLSHLGSCLQALDTLSPSALAACIPVSPFPTTTPPANFYGGNGLFRASTTPPAATAPTTQALIPARPPSSASAPEVKLEPKEQDEHSDCASQMSPPTKEKRYSQDDKAWRPW